MGIAGRAKLHRRVEGRGIGGGRGSRGGRGLRRSSRGAGAVTCGGGGRVRGGGGGGGGGGRGVVPGARLAGRGLVCRGVRRGVACATSPSGSRGGPSRRTASAAGGGGASGAAGRNCGTAVVRRDGRSASRARS